MTSFESKYKGALNYEAPTDGVVRNTSKSVYDFDGSDGETAKPSDISAKLMNSTSTYKA